MPFQRSKVQPVMAVDLRKRGFTYQEIADQLGTTIGAVKYALDMAHSTGLYAKLMQEGHVVDSGKIMALHNAGWPIHKIADEMTMKDSDVAEIIKKQKGRECEVY